MSRTPLRKKTLILTLLLTLLASPAASKTPCWTHTTLDSVAISGFSNDDMGVMYTGTSGKLYRSIDRGLTWETVIDDWANTYIDNIVVLNANTILLGTSGFGIPASVGIYRSSDAGNSWTRVALSDTSVWALCRQSETTMFAGDDAGNVYRSTDGGVQWPGVRAGGTSGGVLSIASDGGSRIIVGCYLGALSRSVDNGLTWSDLAPAWGVQYVYVLRILAPNILLAGTELGLFKSLDFGNTWVKVAEEAITTGIADLVIVPPSRIYALSAAEHLYYSQDSGDHWTDIGAGLPGGYLYDMAIDAGILYVGTDVGVFTSCGSVSIVRKSWGSIKAMMLDSPSENEDR